MLKSYLIKSYHRVLCREFTHKVPVFAPGYSATVLGAKIWPNTQPENYDGVQP